MSDKTKASSKIAPTHTPFVFQNIPTHTLKSKEIQYCNDVQN